MKIRFSSRPSRIRTPGLNRPRCTAFHPKTGATCDKPMHDASQSHRWSIRNYLNAKRKRPSAPKQKHFISFEARPAVECLLWYYAMGKPKEMVEHSGTLSLQQELSQLTDEQLRERALQVADMLKRGSKPSDKRIAVIPTAKLQGVDVSIRPRRQAERKVRQWARLEAKKPTAVRSPA